MEQTVEQILGQTKKLIRCTTLIKGTVIRHKMLCQKIPITLDNTLCIFYRQEVPTCEGKHRLKKE